MREQSVHPSSFYTLDKEHPSSASAWMNPPAAHSARETNEKKDKSCQQNRSSWAEKKHWTGSPIAQWSSSGRDKEKHHYGVIILKGENKRTVCFTEPSKVQKKGPAQPSSPQQTIEIWAPLSPLSSLFSTFPEASALGPEAKQDARTPKLRWTWGEKEEVSILVLLRARGDSFHRGEMQAGDTEPGSSPAVFG